MGGWHGVYYTGNVGVGLLEVLFIGWANCRAAAVVAPTVPAAPDACHRNRAIRYVGSGLKPAHTIAIAIVAPSIRAAPAAHHRNRAILYLGSGLKPAPTIAAVIVAPSIPAAPAAHHRNRAIRYVGSGSKPVPTVAVPVVARTIAANHTGSWHQRQTDTSVNSAKRRQINPVSLYYCDNGRHRRGGFQTRPNHRHACCRPNHRRARRHPHHRRFCNWLTVFAHPPSPAEVVLTIRSNHLVPDPEMPTSPLRCHHHQQMARCSQTMRAQLNP